MIFDEKYAVCEDDEESNSSDSACEDGIIFKVWSNQLKYDNESGKISGNEQTWRCLDEGCAEDVDNDKDGEGYNLICD